MKAQKNTEKETRRQARGSGKCQKDRKRRKTSKTGRKTVEKKVVMRYTVAISYQKHTLCALCRSRGDKNHD
ncbi:MAG: hypothetical protein RRZ93_00015 [Ruthenibacterium sp.]